MTKCPWKNFKWSGKHIAKWWHKSSSHWS